LRPVHPLIIHGMPDPILWSPQPRDLVLPDCEIHIWRAELDLEPTVLERLRGLLALDEESRADRFHFPRDRNHFIACRAALRELLGAYMGIPPTAIEFSYGTYGKPALGVNDSRLPLRFNISHAGGLAVLAFARGREIGIDLEPVPATFPGEEIAMRYFSPRELAELRALPPAERAEGFSLCWTGKEAYAKARGLGLQIRLDSFSVSLTPGQPGTLHSEDSDHWTLHSFQPSPNFVAAVVSEGTKCALRYWDWRGTSRGPQECLNRC
jgi:4'-phosphopantetheinyl transferase